MKRSLLVGLGTIAIVGAVGGALFVQNRRTALVGLSKPRIAPARMPTAFKVQKEQEAFEKVRIFRDKWRDKWALPHKDLLVVMRKAPLGNDSAWMNVINQLPSYRDLPDLGMEINTREERDPQNQANPDYVLASWNPPWPVKLARPELAEQAKQVSQSHKTEFQKDMAQWHDVRLTEMASLAANRTCCLWASGRVTWEQNLPNKIGTGAQTTYVYPEEQQVMPPFDFLPQ